MDVDGAGSRTIVCLHGLGRSPRDWAAVGPELEAHGTLNTPQLPSDPAAALATLEGEVAPGSLIIGHSLGGVLALRLARAGRIRPRGLVLTSCFFPPARNGRALGASLRDYAGHRIAFLREARAARGEETRGRGPSGTGRGLGSLLRVATDGATFKPDPALPGALVVHASDDHYVPVDFALAAAAKFGWPASVLPGGGHYPHLGRPEEWLARVVPWIESSA